MFYFYTYGFGTYTITKRSIPVGGTSNIKMIINFIDEVSNIVPCILYVVYQEINKNIYKNPKFIYLFYKECVIVLSQLQMDTITSVVDHFKSLHGKMPRKS